MKAAQVTQLKHAEDKIYGRNKKEQQIPQC